MFLTTMAENSSLESISELFSRIDHEPNFNKFKRKGIMYIQESYKSIGEKI
jgi:hypothetical protein